MKTKILLSISLVLFVGSQLFTQTTGGPDAYGYVWASSTNTTTAATPVYNWIDIRTTGTQITGLVDDNSVGPFLFGFNFHYYWFDYSKIWVGSNGWVSFQNLGNIAAAFPVIPTSKAKNTIDPLLSDLTFIAANSTPVPGASAWFWTNNNDSVIVEYDSIPFWVSAAPGYSGINTFQVILSGVDSSITFQYKIQKNGTAAYDIANEGLRTGIENVTGLIGLQVQSNTYPADTAAVKFYYPKPVTYQAIDVAPVANQNSSNGGFFVSAPYGPPITLRSDVGNVGNVNVGSFNVTGKVLNSSSATVYTSNLTSPASLPVGKDTMMDFPATFQTNAPGTYTFRTTSTLSTDANATNNIQNTEMDVVDTSQAIIHLVYSPVLTTTLGVSWQGGNGGAAIYVEPPFYPATITSIDYLISGNSGNKGFAGILVDDNGLFGGPGTQLDSVFIPKTSVVVGQYNTVTLTSPYTIISGGIYAGWLMGGDSINLGVDTIKPIAHRGYEIIGGSWSIYRDNDIADPLIRVNLQGSSTTGTNNLNENILTLSQNYPNPSSIITMINYSLPSSGEVLFSVRNILGQEMDAVNFGNQISGSHTLKMNTSKFAPGIYFYSLKFGDKEVTKKMVVSR